MGACDKLNEIIYCVFSLLKIMMFYSKIGYFMYLTAGLKVDLANTSSGLLQNFKVLKYFK